MPSEQNLQPCFEINPCLDEKSVINLLQQFANVLGELWFHRHEYDDNWINGCRAYGWIKNFLVKNHKKLKGVAILSTPLNFVFTLNRVPLQFVTDKLDSPKKKHRLCKNDVECRQLSLFEDDVNFEHDVTWRVLAEKLPSANKKDEDIEPPTWLLALIGFDSSNNVVSRYELVSKVHAPVQAANTDVLPEAVETPPLNLQLRVKNAKKADSDKYGTI
ncbi:hypothetical protein RNM32_002503 [Escherichia coli]|nr:hypothetical protein [Escherichia coli]ELF7457756.1 hypothetical protein [Escherichia coli]